MLVAGLVGDIDGELVVRAVLVVALSRANGVKGSFHRKGVILVHRDACGYGFALRTVSGFIRGDSGDGGGVGSECRGCTGNRDRAAVYRGGEPRIGLVDAGADRGLLRIGPAQRELNLVLERVAVHGIVEGGFARNDAEVLKAALGFAFVDGFLCRSGIACLAIIQDGRRFERAVLKGRLAVRLDLNAAGERAVFECDVCACGDNQVIIEKLERQMVERRGGAGGKGESLVAACIAKLAIIRLALALPKRLLPAGHAFNLGWDDGRAVAIVRDAASARRDLDARCVVELVVDPAVKGGVIVIDNKLAC